MKNIKFSRLFAAALLVACFAFAGCKQPINNYSVSVVGNWVSEYQENWTITATSVDTGAYSYAGDNLVIVMDDETSGRMFIKYTRAQETTDVEPTGADADTWSYSSWNNNWYRYSTTAPDVGKWYAISFKELEYSKVQMAGAWKAAGVTSKDTLEEAMAEFTVANGYFSSYSTFAKQ